MLSLNRIISNSKGTFGVLLNQHGLICYTYELPWLGNIQNQSCIPEGDYAVVKATSARFGEVFYIKNVPGREGILIHAGNTKRDTRGCILPGLDIDDLGVVHSRDALTRLYKLLPSSFNLSIKGA